MESKPTPIEMIIEPISKLVTNLTTSSNMDNLETKSENSPKPDNRRSSRTRKKRRFFHEEHDSSNSRNRKSKNMDYEEGKEDLKTPEPPTREDCRQKNINKLTEVFRVFISDKLDELDLPPDHEQMRVTGLEKSLKNALSLEKKVYDSTTGVYLVTSSDGKCTYTVKSIAIGEKIKYACNCGEKYQDINRTSCKHCFSVIFHNISKYLTDYLTKPYQPNTNLQLHNVNKMLNRIDIEDKDVQITPKKKKGDFFEFLL